MGESHVGPLSFKQGREVEHALGNGIEPLKVGVDLAQSWIQSSLTREVVATMLSLGPDEALRRLCGEKIEQTTFLGLPTNLQMWFQIQAETYRSIRAGKEAGMDEDKFKDVVMTAARDFQYRQDLAAIGLTECFLVPYGLRPEFWVEVGGIDNSLSFPAYRNYDGVVTPEKGTVLAIQGQFGQRYRNKKPIWCRQHLHAFEQGMTIEERLAGHAVFGAYPLARIFSDIIGSVSGVGSVPCLRWVVGPRLFGYWDDDALPYCGSASRGKCPSDS